MKTRPILALFTVAAGLACLSLKPMLHAQQASPSPAGAGPGWFHRQGRFMALRRAFEKLNVSSEQKQAALAVLRSHQPAIKPLVDSLVKERFALHDVYKASTVDEMAVRAQSSRVAAVEADLAVQKAYLFHDLRGVATPEQLHTLDAMETSAEIRLVRIIDLVNDWIANS